MGYWYEKEGFIAISTWQIENDCVGHKIQFNGAFMILFLKEPVMHRKSHDLKNVKFLMGMVKGLTKNIGSIGRDVLCRILDH